MQRHSKSKLSKDNSKEFEILLNKQYQIIIYLDQLKRRLRENQKQNKPEKHSSSFEANKNRNIVYFN